jgi:hypothetical protein
LECVDEEDEKADQRERGIELSAVRPRGRC